MKDKFDALPTSQQLEAELTESDMESDTAPFCAARWEP